MSQAEFVQRLNSLEGFLALEKTHPLDLADAYNQASSELKAKIVAFRLVIGCRFIADFEQLFLWLINTLEKLLPSTLESEHPFWIEFAFPKPDFTRDNPLDDLINRLAQHSTLHLPIPRLYVGAITDVLRCHLHAMLDPIVLRFKFNHPFRTFLDIAHNLFACQLLRPCLVSDLERLMS